ncbi:hypothetical protein J5N97_003868 [Dioscorea zingiberensis]|uniref:Uncharacterized protein n=1 Tax=Dioscorea zingiberensis TaxID=325984 RepID=A0A9D5D6X0_9LILI|nr:hypothetical protein J5N97_003868 [Dioscorea zingiberensis]
MRGQLRPDTTSPSFLRIGHLHLYLTAPTNPTTDGATMGHNSRYRSKPAPLSLHAPTTRSERQQLYPSFLLLSQHPANCRTEKEDSLLGPDDQASDKKARARQELSKDRANSVPQKIKCKG